MAKPIVVTQHVHVFLTLKELDGKLNKLALEGWTVITTHPTVANIASLDDKATMLVLLRREVEI